MTGKKRKKKIREVHGNMEDKEEGIGEARKISEPGRARLHLLSEHHRRKKISTAIGRQRLVA